VRVPGFVELCGHRVATSETLQQLNSQKSSDRNQQFLGSMLGLVDEALSI